MSYPLKVTLARGNSSQTFAIDVTRAGVKSTQCRKTTEEGNEKGEKKTLTKTFEQCGVVAVFPFR